MPVEEALVDCFEKTNREIKQYPIDCYLSGSTCVSIFQFKHEIWCANIGDSRAIIGKKVD